VWIIAIVLLALVGVGGWWSYQNGLLGQWLPAVAPVTAASGEIIIEQAQPVALPVGQAAAQAAGQAADQTAQAANAQVVTGAAETVAETAAEAVATPATATSEPVVITGVAGVNGAVVWDDAGSVIGTLDSGALLDVKASAADRAWLFVETASGAGWVQSSEVIAYGLGRLEAVLLPGAVAAATTQATTSAPADAAADAAVTSATAGTVDDGSVLAATAEEVAVSGQPASAAVALAATVTGTGSNLNVRSGPGTDYAVVAKAADGSQYQAVGRNEAGDWLLLQLSDDAANVGWAASEYIELGGDLQTLPVVE
jgi:hypothetical protein